MEPVVDITAVGDVQLATLQEVAQGLLFVAQGPGNLHRTGNASLDIVVEMQADTTFVALLAKGGPDHLGQTSQKRTIDRCGHTGQVAESVVLFFHPQ